jgi:hypothetical protein
MRGVRVSPALRKFDVVLVAARYQSQKPELDFAQGYIRRGSVWSDLQLLRRSELIEQVAQGKKVVTGKPASLPGEFEADERVELSGQHGSRLLRAAGAAGPGDDLSLPLV